MRKFFPTLLVIFVTACAVAPVPHSQDDSRPATASMNPLAEDYVKLVLALGTHDEGYVDAYYGPPEWRTAETEAPRSLPQIEADAEALIVRLVAVDTAQREPIIERRREYLLTQTRAVLAYARRLQGTALRFDAEAQALYGVAPPHYREADFEPALARLAALLPGEGSLTLRYNAYLDRYNVPRDRLEALMHDAITETQRRTVSHMPLPLGERFELTLVQDQPWSAYNWYQGQYLSRIEVNTDLPVSIQRVLVLAAHEGYPGHHAYNASLEVNLVRDRGWVEYMVYPLYSPQSLIAEGSADYGIALAFPGVEREQFVAELMRRAGFDPAEAAHYLQVIDAAQDLAPAAIEVAHRYLDGDMARETASAWLQRYALASKERAEQRLKFIERYRSYIINYSYGEQLVRGYVEGLAGAETGSDAQWQVYFDLLSTPHTPAELIREP